MNHDAGLHSKMHPICRCWLHATPTRKWNGNISRHLFVTKYQKRFHFDLWCSIALYETPQHTQHMFCNTHTTAHAVQHTRCKSLCEVSHRVRYDDLYIKSNVKSRSKGNVQKLFTSTYDVGLHFMTVAKPAKKCWKYNFVDDVVRGNGVCEP